MIHFLDFSFKGTNFTCMSKGKMNLRFNMLMLSLNFYLHTSIVFCYIICGKICTFLKETERERENQRCFKTRYRQHA